MAPIKTLHTITNIPEDVRKHKLTAYTESCLTYCFQASNLENRFITLIESLLGKITNAYHNQNIIKNKWLGTVSLYRSL